MNDSNLSSVPEDEEISLLDLLQTVADNLRLLILGPLLAGLAALGIAFAIAPTYTATVRFLPPQQQQSAAASMLASLGALGGLAGAASGLKNPSDQYLAFIKSRTVQDALIDRFDLIKRYEADLRDDARRALQATARASSGSKDGLITVEVDDKDPKFAAQLANAHVEELQKLLARLAVTEAQQRRVFFEKQLQSAKDNLTRAEQALKASGVNSSALKTSPQAAVEGVARLRAGITAQEIKIASLRGYLSETAPEFRQALTELSAMRTQLARAEAQEPQSAGGSDYVARYRDFKYYETLFDLFAKQYEVARVDESREGAVIQVLDAAKPPERKSKPKKALIAVITTLAVGFALLLFVFVRQALANASRNQESAEKLSRLKTAFGRALGRG
jgi:uncharacterized protein involved in exopolysaccharide biosynthesis